ncbi:hypothetical protein EDD28_1301 [Salana multivorans]|uniref:Cgl0159-like domain-containing protein n=1 Tax=Salana multivorans TaxID=120377 RepID=A0A3N2DA92_9MICO|nr:hypothetical protein [Salana multivorans]ROR96710.1 hypothetical protein EDD28_1301 [Salana multivorans]
MTPSTSARLRLTDPSALRRRLQQRDPFVGLRGEEQLLLVALDHPARGSLDAGGRPMAMADRADLLDRAAEALSRPGVHGVVGTADTLEELALRGLLDGRLVIGSMNRGGLHGSTFEVDDRFTAYSPAGVVEAGLDGGKMLLRMDLADPATARTVEACAGAVEQLARAGRTALVEPFIVARDDTGRLRTALDVASVVRSVTIASGLGSTSAHTWLKLPALPDMEPVMAATTLPALLLGGEIGADLDGALAVWGRALRVPGVQGLVVGRALLYPPGDDVAGAVDAARSLLVGPGTTS